MPIGTPAQSFTGRVVRATALAALSAVPTFALGQHYRPAEPGPGEYSSPQGHYGPVHHDGFSGPAPMEGGACPPAGYDLAGDVGIEGPLVDQRGPHYFDLRAEAVYLTRDETFGPDINFTSLGIAPPVGPPNIVLSSGDLDYDPEPGFRILGRFDICPLAVLEFGYMGVFDFESSAAVEDPNNQLFSLFSEFGTNPITTIPPVTDPGGPMPETERASRHAIAIESELQTAEITYRRYWCGFSPRVSGTLLAGFRHTKLDENFVFSSQGSEPLPNTLGPLAALDYFVRADNDLSGFQSGADVWIGLSQGLRFGMEGKAGIYNNHFTLENEVVTTPLGTTPPTLFERFRDNQVAFIGEASVDLVADILPSWSLRVGYEVLFIDSVVLAGENFNTGSPFNPGPLDNGIGPLRVPFLEDDSDVFYHGGHAGIEFIW